MLLLSVGLVLFGGKMYLCGDFSDATDETF